MTDFQKMICAPSKCLAYLFSRFPHVSQTFTDHEMLGLERLGYRILLGSIHPPTDSSRHPHLDSLRADWLYAPPREVVRELERRARADGSWPGDLVERHLRDYGEAYKPAVRAANALYFARHFVARGVRHVHVPFANRATHTMLFLKAMTGITFSFTTHGQDFMHDLGSNDLLREMAREAEFVVAVCDYSRDLLQKLCPESAGKIHRIYNGLDTAAFPVLPAPARTPEDPFRLLSVGRLIEFKGFHVLIEALAEYVRRGGHVLLRIVGEGPWRERLETRAAELGVGSRVEFCGRLGADAVRAELAKADAFALGCVMDECGVTDLLPTVITEAMLSGLPVISTRLAGVPEMVLDGITGVLAEPGDVSGLADAIARIAAMPDRGRALGAAGRRRALELFSLDKTLPQLSELLSPLCSAADPVSKPALVAYYDLGLPGRMDWLEIELPVLREVGARILCALPSEKKSLQEMVRRLPDDLEYLPDGMVMEMEWNARANWRRQLEAVRTQQLGVGVDGEMLLLLARRALWLRRVVDGAGSSVLFTPGSEESLCAWLAAQISPVQRAAAFDASPAFSRSLLEMLAAEAVAVSDGSGKLDGVPDFLSHGGSPTERIRFGPVSFRRKSKLPTDAARRESFRQWLQGCTAS